LKIWGVEYFKGDFVYFSVLGVAASSLEFVFDEEGSFFEHVVVVVLLECKFVEGFGLGEVEYFLGVFLEEDASIHFVEGYFLLAHLLSSETGFLFFLEA